jgi:MscS family membrane protein
MSLLLQVPGISFSGEAIDLLKPANTDSPRSTLKSFIETLNEGYRQRQEIIQNYFASSRLYLSAEQQADVDRTMQNVARAERALDLSELPTALADKVAMARVLQLKEILDRIELPPFESIPDAEAMESVEFQHWTIPDTEITIHRIVEGPRAGEYLFSPETVERLPEFYRTVRYAPYKSGASAGWYEGYRYGGGGLYKIIPYRWMAALPQWSMQLVLDQPLWRWIGVAIVLATASLIYLLVYRISKAMVQRRTSADLQPHWSRFLKPFILVALLPLVAHLLTDNLRISGIVLEFATLAIWAIFTLAFTWTVWVGLNLIAENIVSSQQLLSGSIDSQLVRLALRLIAVILAVTILVVGAQHLGIPAYSVIAGLGVGGIAVALAARDSLANILGSLLIMFEKPFRVGHWIRVGDSEGTVENVGFRSTRIRTFYNSLISIPNNELINTTIDNMELRNYRRVRTVLQITYDTSSEKIRSFVEGIKQIIANNPNTYKGSYQVVFNEFGAHSLDIFLNFHLEVPDWQTELEERERILLEILELAESMSVRFAFPTSTLHVESMPATADTTATQ